MKDKPIVFKDGVKVNMSVTSTQWIDGDVLQKEIEYISKMTEGLVTGSMSNDHEYIFLKNKIIKELIKDTVGSLKEKIVEAAKKKSAIFEDAQKKQQELNMRSREYAKLISSDNLKTVYQDESTGEYKTKNTPVTIALNGKSPDKKRWEKIEQKLERDRQELIDKMQNKKDESILNEMAEMKKGTKTTKKTTKKITKKKVAKKRDRK